MGGRNLCSAAAIYQLESRDRAPLIIGAQDDATENAVPHNSRSDVVYAITALLEFEWRLLILKTSRCADPINARQQQLIRVQAQINNAVEIGRPDWADRRLGATGNPSLVVEQASFN